MKKINYLISLRIRVGKYYDEKNSKISRIEVLEHLNNSISVYQIYTILILS